MEKILSPLARQQHKRFDCIAGGSSRHRSIQNGIQFILKRSLCPDMVVVHDGARPHVDNDTLHKLVSECHNTGVCIPITYFHNYSLINYH